MQHNFDFDLDLCEVLLQTPKKSYRLVCTYTFERVKWSICAFTRMTDNVIHCWFYLSTWICFVLEWWRSILCSVRDISSKEVLQLQSRADAKGSGMMTPIICWECASLDHLSSTPKWTSTPPVHHPLDAGYELYNQCCVVISIFKEPSIVVFLYKHFRMRENCWFWVFREKIRTNELLHYFKNLKESVIFMKELMVF